MLICYALLSNLRFSGCLISGSPIFQLHSFDPDNGPNGTVTYSIPQDAPPSPFSISLDGVVKLNGTLNYNAQNNYTLLVTATDGGGLKGLYVWIFFYCV